MSQLRIVPPIPDIQTLEDQFDFSVVAGGPLYQVYLRTSLMRSGLELLLRRIVIITLICWIPLLVLSTIEGHLTRGVPVPFLRDPEVQVRFLLALPLLIGSEVFVHRRLRLIVPQFVYRGIIASEDQANFQKAVASAMRLRNSAAVEAILLALVLTFGYWIWNTSFTLTMSTWYRAIEGGVPHLTAPGRYYAFASLTIFRFILIRWYFRLFIWYRFLWQVNRMPLHFNLFHPDRSGGLGFLAGSIAAFTPVFIAQTMVISSNIYSHILYDSESLSDFRMPIAAMLVFVVLVLLLPLAFFAARLARAARAAKLEFGILSSHYVNDFHRKWIGGGGRGEGLLGTPDLQSLADLANSFNVVAEMRLLPVGKQSLLRLIVLIGLPFLPLVFTMIPLNEVIKSLFKLAF
jgi:hypothetical protein